MKSLIRENGAEALVGLLVVLLAAWFVTFALARTGGRRSSNAIEVTALFPNAVGVSPGTDIRVAGVKVGEVASQKLDPQSFQVAMKMALDPAIKLPSDSSAAVTSEGLLGGTYVAIVPGGSETPLKNGDTIIDTQGSLDMMGLIGQFINKSGSDGGSSGSPSAGGSSTPDSAAAASRP
jgi:phospholipid/cholesterol/gamma-HCH transport system substrate-binding protein